MRQLYHYTCRGHGLAGILADRLVRPNRRHLLVLPEPLAWLTDLDAPNVDALGLTTRLLSCDRSEVRVTVDGDRAERWVVYARQAGVTPEQREALESATGAMPAHWWVSEQPVPVLRIDDVHAAVVERSGR